MPLTTVRKTPLSGHNTKLYTQQLVTHRWVGFDMDECLGSFMGLWPFTDLLPDQAGFSQETRDSYIAAIARRLATNDRVWLFRPQLGPLLKDMRLAKERKQIAGCFILTNNGSAAITECVRQMLNIRAGTDLFLVAWNRYTPCRRKMGIMTKNLECVHECLRASGFIKSQEVLSDLLYFDDMPTHALATELPANRYIAVKPYFHYTPVEVVKHELRGIFQQFEIDGTVLERVVREGIAQEAADLKADKELSRNPPASAESWSLLGAFQNFQHGAAASRNSSKSGVTRRRRTVGTKGSTMETRVGGRRMRKAKK